MIFVLFFAMAAAVALIVANSIAYLMFGWGLAPQSWFYIIGFGVFGNLIVHGIVQAIGAAIAKEIRQ